jgi:hypothetical protein
MEKTPLLHHYLMHNKIRVRDITKIETEQSNLLKPGWFQGYSQQAMAHGTLTTPTFH